jgi:hypothetical protein
MQIFPRDRFDYRDLATIFFRHLTAYRNTISAAAASNNAARLTTYHWVTNGVAANKFDYH